jgi:hypothetical protein
MLQLLQILVLQAVHLLYDEVMGNFTETERFLLYKTQVSLKTSLVSPSIQAGDPYARRHLALHCILLFATARRNEPVIPAPVST